MIVGVSCDSQKANKSFKEKQGFPFDLLCDTDGEMSRAYGALVPGGKSSPSRISYVIGPDGKVRNAYPKVSPAKHPDEVLADLS